MNRCLKNLSSKILCLFILGIGLASCDKGPSDDVQVEPEAAARIQLSNASLPNLFKDSSNQIWMSYVTNEEKISSLWLSHWQGTNWSTPELVAQGENWFVNWADFPSVVTNADTFIAHWLQKNGSGTYAYGVQYANKLPGADWKMRGLIHADESPTEHGFVSLQPGKNGTHAIWLDGRNMQADAGHNSHAQTTNVADFDIDSVQGMTLRYALIDQFGNVTDRQEIDNLTCDCCQTSAAETQQGLVIAYRDREVRDANTEIRDIKILRQTSSGWIPALNTPVDNWDIQACPVNGPVMAANKNQLALAWFTAAQQKSKVQVAFSDDNGQSFSNPFNVDVENNLGRVGADWINDNAVVVTWLGMHNNQAELLSRIVKVDGDMQDIKVIEKIDMARGSGFPQVATIENNKVMYVWTQTGETPTIQTQVNEF